MAFSMSQSNNAARWGSTSSAKVAGICLPPISNVGHLRKTIWPEAYAPDNAGVNGDFDTTVMRPFATVCLSRGSREGWLQRGRRQEHLTARLRECNFQRRRFLPSRETPMGKVQSIVLVRWVADREIVVCGLLNRMSRAPKIKKFFVLVSWIGDGKAWYLLMVALPLIYGEKGLATSWNMVIVGIVNLALYKAVK